MRPNHVVECQILAGRPWEKSPVNVYARAGDSCYARLIKPVEGLSVLLLERSK